MTNSQSHADERQKRSTDKNCKDTEPDRNFGKPEREPLQVVLFADYPIKSQAALEYVL